MYDVNLTKLNKEYVKYAGVLIFGILMLLLAIYIVVSLKKINNNTTNYVEVNNYEKTREDFLFGSYKYKIKYYYKLNGNEYVCKKTHYDKYIIPTRDEKVYIKDFKYPEKCTDDFTLTTYSLSLLAIVYIGALCFGLSIVNYKPTKNKLNDVKELMNNGVLVKNAPYYKNIISRRKNGDPFVGTVIHVKTPSGEYIRFSPLYGTVKYFDKGGTVDVLYDPNNYENYYVAKEINRKDGNKESDYFHSTKEELEKLRRYSFEIYEELYYRNKKRMKKIRGFLNKFQI